MRIFFPIPRFAVLAAGMSLLFWLAASASAQLRLSEFMASNTNGVQDEDGDYSDWVEIYNASNAAVNLEGWHLTDGATNLAQWTFPATNMPAGGFLVVFASGKDRTAPRLHANFSLSSDGEYLALVRPDGTTIEHEYAPAFPEQYANVSYGIQTHGANPTLRAGQPGYLIRRTPGTTNSCLPAPHPAYSDDSVARIDLAMPQSTWDWLMWDNPETEVYRPIDLRFRHGDVDVVVTNVGIQCRGNTSLTKQPRSFNIAFDTFVPDQTLFGLERLNLNSDVNDPATARPKLLNDLQNALGLPTSYANHAAVVVSNTTSHSVFFDAVRNNTQPVDDVFLSQRFGNKRGNLYKCNNREWSATLEKRNPSVGSSYIGNGTTYDLKYAGAGDTTYNDLAAFINLINDTASSNFPNAIMNAFDVDGFLQRMALDVLTGNWDNYWGTANNYHLFRHPDTRRWVYIPYDFDNAMGISWDGTDWGNRNIYNWENFSGSTPLATKIFAVQEFKNRYSYYMKQMLTGVYSNSVLDPSIFRLRASMTNALPFGTPTVSNMKSLERQRYSGEWPYWSYDNFWYSYEYPHSQQYWEGYGITEFIGVRRASALSQLGTVTNIAPILSGFVLIPSQPRSNDALSVSIRAFDDVAVTNVAFYYSFQGGATNVAPMALQPDGTYAAALPAFGATGTVRYSVRALDNTGKATYHPYGGATYAATVQVGSGVFDLIVTELNYNPYALAAAETNAGITDKENFEFVELHNAGNAALDLTGWKFTEGIGGTFPAFTLGAGEYAVIVKNTNAFRIRYTNSAIRVIGAWTSGNLSNGGETVRLENAQSGVIASIPYSDKGDWPGRADGDGSTLELIDPVLGYADPFNWRSSSEYGGSPGAASLGPDNRIVVNEVLTHTDPPLSDSIELFNTTLGAIHIGGWYLTDSKANYRKYAIPAGTVLPAGGYIVFNETNHFNVSGGANTNDFSLDGAHGEDVYLVQTDARSNLVRFVDHEEFGAAANGESFGRWPNGTGRLYPMVSRTFGSANSGPRVGPLFLSEVMYAPPSGSNHLEFVEIANPGNGSQDLSRWQLDGGIAFAFTNGTSLPADGVLVVLSFDPNAASNSARLADFNSVYAITNTVLFAGPYSGALADTGERVRLLRPDDPPAEEPTYYPMLIEDEVAYSNDLPWAPEAAGGGASLERLVPAAWGDSFTSWSGTTPPTPGKTAEPVPTFVLTIASAHGNPSPAIGAHVVAADAFLSNSVPSPETVGGARYLCAGWTLAHHDPASGTTNWMTMTLTNDATLTWLWNTNFLLTATAGAGGAIEPSGGWQAVGATVALEAVASNLYAFAGWTGDTNAIVAGSATSAAISVRLDAPVALAAHFAAVVPTYYVSPAGTHVAPYTNWITASTSLQFIVDYVPAGSTVLVAAATYPLTSQLAIGKALHLKSAAGPGAAILDGGNATRVLYLSHAEAIVEGFALQNGNSVSSSGGGVRIEPAGQLVNCILRNNVSQKYGGGAALLGGGELRNCLLHDNAAGEWGGGLYTFTASDVPLVQSCTFSGNSAGDGGGVYLNGTATLRNSIVWGNTASSGSNVFLSGSGQSIQTTLSGPAQSGTGNLGVSPRFAATNEFRLAPDSPAINVGTPQSWMTNAVDLDSRPRVIYGTNDLGAYEGLLVTVDSDLDRVGDWQEAQAGTDPFDGASFLGIQSAAKGTVLSNTFVLGWSSATGRSYRIAYGTNMAAPFAFVAYSNIPADPPANSFTGALVQPGATYYRIELEP
jgi:spore coat protein CotH